MRVVLASALLLAVHATAMAQLSPGELLAAVRDPYATFAQDLAALHQVSADSGTVQRLTISSTLRAEGISALTMTSAATGVLATAPASGARGTVRAFTLTGTTLADTRLDTQPMPGQEIRQLAVSGADVWFVCRDPNGRNGYLGRLPLAGGAPVVVVDFAMVPGYRGSFVAGLAIAGANAIVAVGNAGTSPSYASQLFQVGLQPPNAVRHLVDLPLSRYATGQYRVQVVGLALDAGQPGTLWVAGRDGDLLRFDLAAGAIVEHRWFVPSGSAPLGAMDCTVVDARSGDLLCGVPSGNVELAVLTHRGVRLAGGLRSNNFSSWDRVTCLWHEPHAAGSHRAFLAGCPGSRNEPTSRGVGAPAAGNGSWSAELRAARNNAPVLLFLGRSNQSFGGVPLPLSLAGLGLPACSLGTSIEVVLPAVTDGAGTALLSMPLPPGSAGLRLFTQWLTFDAALLIEALSDARTLVPG